MYGSVSNGARPYGRTPLRSPEQPSPQFAWSGAHVKAFPKAIEVPLEGRPTPRHRYEDITVRPTSTVGRLLATDALQP